MSDVVSIVRALPLQWEWGGLLCGFAIFWFVIWLLVAIWVYQDAESRGASGALWLLVVLLLGLIGLIVYLVVRPSGPRPAYAAYPGYAPQYQQPGYQYPPYQQPSAPVQPPAVAPTPAPQAGTPNCPRCGRPLEYVYQYQRWYCRTENVYPWG